MTEDIFYIIETKKSKCSCCGKSIKNIYHYNGKEYGYYCFMSVIGKSIDQSKSSQRPLPNWIIDLMNKYFESNKNGWNKNDEHSISVNFIGEHMTKSYPDHALWHRTIEVCNRKLPVYQQYMVDEYLQMRLKYYLNSK